MRMANLEEEFLEEELSFTKWKHDNKEEKLNLKKKGCKSNFNTK
jgi:hypothetical protein